VLYAKGIKKINEKEKAASVIKATTDYPNRFRSI